MLNVNNLVKKAFNGEILKNLSFIAKRGEITAIIGPSGSGKTTLLRCLAQLTPISSGNVQFSGQDLKELSHGEIGLVFQNFHLFPHLTILDNLILAPVSQGIPREEVVQKAHHLLKQFSLNGKEKRFPGEISGGQKQRIAIARALMLDPPLLLFDEPTSALDPEMVKEVGEIISSLQDSKRVIILVTHEVRLAQQIANRVLFLDHGVLLDNVESKEFFSTDSTKLSKRAQKFLSNIS
ncbi:MAG: amino acid ABC transporter ATP-binding protein [Alphaproteobacteria bacterium]|nr:amino acid ABC transporter ATP-binding protein [Alphaproteobacteria bacterium]